MLKLSTVSLIRLDIQEIQLKSHKDTMDILHGLNEIKFLLQLLSYTYLSIDDGNIFSTFQSYW